MTATMFVPAEHIADMVARFNGGESVTKIAASSGYTEYMVGRLLRGAGVEIRRSRAKVRDVTVRAAIYADYLAKTPQRKIARRYRMDDALVKRIIEQESMRVKPAAAVIAAMPDDEDDKPKPPPRWAVAAYRQRIAAGMAEPVARRVSHLTQYAQDAIDGVALRSM